MGIPFGNHHSTHYGRLTHPTLKSTLGGRYYSPQFTDEKAEVLRVKEFTKKLGQKKLTSKYVLTLCQGSEVI